MEQVLKRPPWWAWFSLMGLEIPSAAIAWAFAVSQSHLVVVSSPGCINSCLWLSGASICWTGC
ncbi:hypothetical protein [Akkermansia muciniphila]|uniref:hypothetical protein n=1 Tax=Akkermansia muciniphila TaxID=239935 RepID=UPI001C06230C|nr:hypothetical protein [Akkermansia muciniphila]QWP46302.1 hypothetical protein J5W59_00785 [Akkermansia muciniphila]